MKKRYTFFITEELDRALKALKARDGMPEAEALRRGLTAFLVQKGILTAPDTTRPWGPAARAEAQAARAAARRRGLPPSKS
jgi:hypothetical protein